MQVRSAPPVRGGSPPVLCVVYTARRPRRLSASAGGATWGARTWGSLPMPACLQPRPGFVMAGAILAGVSARRPSCRSGAAAVLRAATGRGTAEARRGTGPSTSTQREAITSGRASAQPGHAATGTDARTQPQRRGRARVEGWRLRPEERAGPGNAGLGSGVRDPRRGHPPPRRRGSRYREGHAGDTIRDCVLEGSGKRSRWLAAPCTRRVWGVCAWARKLPRGGAGCAVILPPPPWLPTGRGPSDRPG
jgi:hypothetical protein